MEQLLTELKKYSRWLQLEGTFPRLEAALEEAEDLRIEAGGRVRLFQWEMEKLEKPGFFQRLKGNQEERKEEVYRELRAAQHQYQQAREEVDLRRQELEDARQEYAALSGSWEAYVKEKSRSGQMSEGEKELLTGICLGLANDCVDALEQARPWMQADVRYTHVREDNRKLEFLGLAEEKANRMRAILELLPEAKIPSYLRQPEGFVTCVTMEYWQLDRLNLAIDQVRELRSRLKTI